MAFCMGRVTGWRSSLGGPRMQGAVEILPEVGLARLFVLDEELPAALRQLLALVQEVGAVDDAEGLPDVVISDDHANAARLEAQDDLLHLGDRDGVDRGE